MYDFILFISDHICVLCLMAIRYGAPKSFPPSAAV